MMVDTVAILCGGLGTRLRHLTSEAPKSLIRVGGKPFLAHQITYLANQGVRNVVLCVGHFGEMIERFVRDTVFAGIRVELSYDLAGERGTARALVNASSILPQDFFVLYGDSYLPIDFRKVASCYYARGRPILMTVYKNDDRFDKSNVFIGDDNLIVYDKNGGDGFTHIDYGLSVFPKSTIDKIAASKCPDLSDFFSLLSRRKKVVSYEVHERFYEIGSMSGLAETEEFMSSYEGNGHEFF